MDMDSEYKENLVSILLDFGEQLLLCGGEIYRVEDTMVRLGNCFGCERVNTFVITSSIVLTLTFIEGKSVTQTRRITSPAGTDYEKLEKLNALSRECVSRKLSPEVLKERLLQTDNSSGHNIMQTYVGSLLVGVAFAVFFGGSFLDGIFGGVFGLVTAFLQSKLEKLCPNRVTFNLLSGFLLGISISLLAGLIPSLMADKIMIGVIMLLIPGIAMTISIRDIIVGETISGSMRLIESLLWATGLACGFMLAIWIVG